MKFMKTVSDRANEEDVPLHALGSFIATMGNSFHTRFDQMLYGLLVMGMAGIMSIAGLGTATAQQDSKPSLKKTLEDNSYSLGWSDGELTGRGGRMLLEKAGKADFVVLGEMHGTREIPQLMSALIQQLQQQGEADYLALEASPWTVGKMTEKLRSGREAYEEFIRKYPVGFPFYNLETESRLVHRFVENSDKKQPLWGLDQIFSFSTNMAFDRLNEIAPTKAARSAVSTLRSAVDTRSASDERLKKLPPSLPAPISVVDNQSFDTLKTHYKNVPEGVEILEELSVSTEIYRLNDSHNYRSNQMRADYLRENLRTSFENVRNATDEQNPQVVVKVGGWHAYKGITPNHALDVGNLSVALAESMGGESFNVAILCGPGSRNRGFPSETRDCWREQLGEDFKSLSKDGPVFFDLSKVHPQLHTRLKIEDERLENFLWAFDAVVLIPDTSPARYIAPPAKK